MQPSNCTTGELPGSLRWADVSAAGTVREAVVPGLATPLGQAIARDHRFSDTPTPG